MSLNPVLPAPLQGELNDICNGNGTPQQHCDVFMALDTAYNGVQNSVYKNNSQACLSASVPGTVDYTVLDTCMCRYDALGKSDFDLCIADHTAKHNAVKSALTASGVPVVDPILAQLRAQLCTQSNSNPDFNLPLTCAVYARSLGLQSGTPDYDSVFGMCMTNTTPAENKIMKNCICSTDSSNKMLSSGDLAACIAVHQPGVPVTPGTSPGNWESDILTWIKNNMVAVSIGAGLLLLLLILLIAH